MFFFIWFGTKHKTRNLGVVADHCEVCDSMQRFEVVDHYEAGHIFSISLTRGEFKGTSRCCLACSTEVMCYKGDYKEFFKRTQAGGMPIDNLAAATNPRLLDMRRDRAALEDMAQRAAASAPADVHDNAPMRLALERLKDVQESGDPDQTRELLDGLKAWDDLDAGGQTVLLDEVNSFVDETKQCDQTVRFLWLMGKSYPLNVGCLPGTLVILGIAAVFVFYPPARSWLWGSIIGVVGVAATFGVYWKIRDAGIRRWVRRKLIPMAEERRIDFDMLIAMLAGVDLKDETIDEPIRDMAQEFESIASVLLERGKIAMPEETDETFPA
ncbi:MAG: hypothetical protein QGH60_03340 [Phycisphaerae bacterium]|jgi:hypothetical protein|nr:hypothetical protein [Phycisphaerae bacterium]